jgi:RNA polymerase sigma-70 factor (ECF subfamily)
VQQPTQDDSQLVERACRGDVEAYGELVRRHQDQALATAYMILRDPQEAQDAAQEAFTKGFLALARFRPDGSFRAWLLRIVVNEARDLRAARRRRADLLTRASGQVQAAAPAESAEAVALAERRREALLESLFQLPEADRLVITCRYFLDLSEAEIADVLGVARGTVKSRLSRAVARLGPILRDIGPLVLVGPPLERALEEAGHAALVQPGADVHQAVLQRLAANSSSALPTSRFRTRVQHVATTAGVAAVAVLIGGVVLVSGGHISPSRPETTNAAGQSVIVYGGDLADADRQELAQLFGVEAGAGPTQVVSRQELVDTLTAQGIAVRPTDEAISSVELVCGPVGSGLQVQTRNITRISAPAYAGALLTAGVQDASVTIAAPASKPVTGETALVGVFKVFHSCSAGTELDPRRTRLAYAQLNATADLAADGPDMTRASAVFLQALQAVVVGQAADAPAIENALNSAALQQGIAMSDRTRGEMLGVLEQLRALDYGRYAHGYSIEELGPDQVRVVARE